MKPIREILERAQIQLVLGDRLIWERAYSEGRIHTIEERRNQQEVVTAWVESHSLNYSMSPKDFQMLKQEIETIEHTEAAARSWEFESVEPLLWACGLVEKLSPASRIVRSDFHPILIGPSVDELCQDAAMRSEKQIALQRDTFMLWYWRCRINQEFSSAKGENIVDAVASAFTPQEAACAKQIKRVKGDFAVHGKPFSQISAKEKHILELCMRWRYHALEWVLNDESWYDTSTDT